MSDSLMAFQPRMELPSKPKPSVNESSSSLCDRHRGVLPDPEQVDELEVDELGAVLLCELQYLGWCHDALSSFGPLVSNNSPVLQRVFAAFAGADPDDLVDRA